MERQIGEKFIDNGVLLEVVEGFKCGDCGVKDCTNNDGGFCFSTSRTDKKNVIFKQVMNAQLNTRIFRS